MYFVNRATEHVRATTAREQRRAQEKL